jgi:beta-glucanase (GH16 family)
MENILSHLPTQLIYMSQINLKLFLTAIFCCGVIATFAQCPTVVWADDFTNSSLDLNKWSYQIGDGCQEGICGWGNNELQSYQQANVTLSNGQLHITSRKERVQAKSYTSGRIRTVNKGDWTYGRFEARIKLPAGKGLWPAFWMLPTDEAYGAWPQSGEIDIMEFVAAQPDHVLGTIHYGDPYPNNRNSGANFYINSGAFSDAFHDFAIEWENGTIRWFVDDILYLTRTSQDISPYHWPFDQRFHFLLNVAVGGNLGGPVDDSIFPAVMDVEYVRVYSGFKPYIEGKRVALYQESNVVYHVGNVSNSTSVSWTVPSGATIVSGQGTSQITVNFGGTSGNVVASVNTTCGTQQLSIPVAVEPAFAKQFSFENFDEPATATLGTFTGTLTEVANPSATGVNTSALVGKYVRNSTQQYDVLTYNISNVTDASQYTNKTKKFYIDIRTSAPIGTEVILQLETSTATSSNYPTGRHSRYVAKTTVQNQWERIPFVLLDKPDAGAPSNGIVRMILLFASNTFTGDTYYYDNLDSYQAITGNAAPVVSVTAPSTGATFASGSSVAVSASASDSDGSISQVEFFANGNSIGVDNSSPYSVAWTIGSGTYNLTARATDNAGAQTTSSTVTVTGQASGSATTVSVSGIVTGTVSGGSGSKFGTATITVRDNFGNPVSNATVTGTFSGSFSETKSGVTGANGSVTVTTTAKLKGSLTVNFCVTNVVHSSLVYNASQNTVTCTGSGARTASVISKELEPDGIVTAYPNPFQENFEVRINLHKESNVQVSLLGINGKLIEQKATERLPAGNHVVTFGGESYVPGLYLVKTRINNQDQYLKQIRIK